MMLLRLQCTSLYNIIWSLLGNIAQGFLPVQCFPKRSKGNIEKDFFWGMFSRAYWAILRKAFTCAEFFFLSNVVWSLLDNIAQCFYLLTNNFYEEHNLYKVVLSLFTACGATMNRGRHWLEHKCKTPEKMKEPMFTSLMLWKWFVDKVL